MSPAFDAVGPSATPQAGTNATTLTWTHVTGSGSSRLLLARVTIGTSSGGDTSKTISSVKYGGVSMTQVGSPVHTDNQHAGYTTLWKLIGPATGSASVVVTMNASTTNLTGGSVSYSGADQTAGVGTPVTAFGSSGTASVTVASNTSGNIIDLGVAAGSPFSAATSPVTSRWNGGAGSSTGAGEAAAGTATATGSSMTLTWGISSSDFWAAIAAEVLAAPTSETGTATAAAHKPSASGSGTASGPPGATVTLAAPSASASGWILVSGTGTAAAHRPSAAAANVRYITGLAGTGAGWFTDNLGSPRLVVGDAAWGLSMNAGRWNSGDYQATFDDYFASRGAQGYTITYFTPLGSTHNGGLHDGGSDWNNDSPWVGGDPGTLNSTFWARIDYMIASAASNGITLFLNAVGYETDMETGGALGGKTSTQYQAYGAALAARYASTPNLVWMVADDYFGAFDTQIAAFLTGLRGGGDTHPIAIENYAESTSRQDLSDSSSLPWGAAHTQFSFVYTYNVTYVGIEHAHLESSPVTPVWGDGYFYQNQATSAEELLVRSLVWWALSSGGRGYVVGDERIWTWPTTAAADVTVGTYPTAVAGAIRAAFEALPGWHLLIPDTSSALVTSGRGTHATSFTSGGSGGEYEASTDAYVTASRVPDGSLAVIFLSHATTIGIDQTKMAAGYTATWLDPASGATSAGTAGSSYNSGAKGSNSAGGPDWVLVLQAPQSASGTGTAAAAKPSASGSGTVTSPAATGTGTASGHRPAASAAGWATVTGTGTAAGHKPSASASGAAEDYVGTGTAAARKPAASGSGWATDSGTATAAAAKPGASAAGYMVPSGTGTAAAHKPSASLTGQAAQFAGSATAAAAKPSAAASGRAEAEGTGTAAARTPGAAAGGTFTPLPVTGTGTAAAAKPSASAAGRAEAEGTGTAGAHKPSASASGTFTALGVSGTGTAAAPRPSAAASGSVSDSAGTATGAAHKPGASGSGSFTPLAVTGTGTAAGHKPAAAASGTFTPLTVSGTGTAGAHKPAASASAHFGIEVTGTGTAALAQPSALARAWWRPAGGTLAYQGSPPFTVPAGAVGGVVTLNGTTAVSVATAAVSSSSLILLTVQPGHAPAGWPRVASITPGTGFTLKSGSGSDTAVSVAWYLVAAV